MLKKESNKESNKEQDERIDTEKLHNKIKEMWPKLSEDNIKLYEGRRDLFFAKLKEVHEVTKVVAEAKLLQLEKNCST